MRILLVLLLTGCTEIQYIQHDLTGELRENPVLPKIKSSELMCLTNDTYQKLYDRERLIREDALTCRAIVESTKRSPNK